MLYPRRTAFTFAVATVLVAAACGDNNDVTQTPDAGMMPDSGLDEDGCRILTLGQRDFSFNLFDQLLGVKFPVTPNLDAPTKDMLHVELWDSTTPNLPPLAEGTFDLSTQSDLAACQHCVWLELDPTNDGQIDEVYVATEGSITIDEITDPLEYVFAGHTSRIVLRRANVGDNSATTLVPGGDCVSITGLTFNTTPTPGISCESAEDCGNALMEICDPSSNKCAAPECNFDAPCEGDNEVCLVQYGNLFDGACYQMCDPSTEDTGCSNSQECVQRGVSDDFGICKFRGDGAVGDACIVEDNTTSCSDAAVCSEQSETCVGTCSFFAQDTGCEAGTACSLFSLCEPVSEGAGVALGATCGANAYLAQGCASDGEAFRGICFAYGGPLKCEKACLDDQGCTTGEFCGQRFSSGLGICQPLPVCGDGVRGEINETCDDGNEADGDGCSGDCQAVDVDYLCDHSTTLTLGTSTQGTTSMGVDGMMSSCQGGLARAQLYSVTPPGPGRLTLHLTSQSTQTLSMRNSCSDDQSEVGCESEPGVPTDQEIVLQVTSTTPAALTAMVSAFTILDEGSYTISADFRAEDCGDGVIEGREVCDDSNELANDGCSADCRTIEYSYYCAQAPVLSTSTVNTGTLVDADSMYGASCAADNGEDIHPSSLFRYTAPAAGTLHLKLVDGTSFAVLSVRTGCGTPAATTETACRPAFLDGELDVPLASGEAITAVVSSFFVDDGIGTFSLEATFTPL